MKERKTKNILKKKVQIRCTMRVKSVYLFHLPCYYEKVAQSGRSPNAERTNNRNTQRTYISQPPGEDNDTLKFKWNTIRAEIHNRTRDGEVKEPQNQTASEYQSNTGNKMCTMTVHSCPQWPATDRPGRSRWELEHHWWPCRRTYIFYSQTSWKKTRNISFCSCMDI